MNTKNLILKLVNNNSSVLVERAVMNFTIVDGIKIETVESFKNRNWDIIHLALKKKRLRNTKSTFLFHFQKAA